MIPFVSSIKPKIKQNTEGLTMLDNHFCIYTSSILKNDIHAQIIAIEIVAFLMASGREVVRSFRNSAFPLCFPGRTQAVIRTLAIWMIHNTKTVLVGNIELQIPNIKAGPALLQNPSIRSPSSFLSVPLAYA